MVCNLQENKSSFVAQEALLREREASLTEQASKVSSLQVFLRGWLQSLMLSEDLSCISCCRGGQYILNVYSAPARL